MMPQNPVVGGSILRRPAIQSPNFEQGPPIVGWAINADGTAYFGDVTAEGTITATSFAGTDFLINSAGVFVYSGTPAAGNLVGSIAASGGTDGFGNNYLAGSASYAATFATALNAGFVAFYSGSLAGGWSALSSVAGDVAGNLQVNAGGQLQLVGSGGVTINGSADTGNPTINSTSTNGLPDGTVHGTSGGASAGTAHTHGPGSFAVGNGQHSHDLQNHDHPF
jgi:hypothetical protein